MQSVQSQNQRGAGGLKLGEALGLTKDVKEQDLVRDLLFTFQGIEGKLIQYSFAEDAFIL